MATLQELRDKRANVWAQAQEFNSRHAAGETMSAEDEQAWTRALDEVDQLGEQIENRERTEQLDQRFGEIDENTERRQSDGTGNSGGGEDVAYRQAFERFIRNGISDLEPDEAQMLRKRSVNLRAQGVATGGAGGFTVPEGFWAKVTETLKFYATVAQFAEVLDTSAGEDIPWPTNDDTSNEGAILSENTQIGEEDVTFGQAELGAYMYTSKLVRVSLPLLQDSGIDIESFLARKLGERIGRITNRHFTVGTGTNQPQGYIDGAAVGKTAAAVNAFTWEELVDLEHSVDVAYRQDARWSFHDLVLAYIRKMKDGDDRPLWSPSIAAGAPDTVLGRPYFVNNYMDSVLEADAIVAAFGNFRSAFVVRNVAGGQLMRLAERYADFLQVGFFAFSRHDSVVQDASAVKVMQLDDGA